DVAVVVEHATDVSIVAGAAIGDGPDAVAVRIELCDPHVETALGRGYLESGTAEVERVVVEPGHHERRRIRRARRDAPAAELVAARAPERLFEIRNAGEHVVARHVDVASTDRR